MPLYFKETENGIDFIFEKLWDKEIEFKCVFDYETACLICEELEEKLENWRIEKVDKKIKKLQKVMQKVVIEKKPLLKTDKLIDKAKKSMKKGC